MTRNWRTSPPIGVTCETPGIVSSRGRMVQSARSRSSMGPMAPPAGAVIATSMISPMIDETGAIDGMTRAGSCCCTWPSRSPTCWRARQMSTLQSNST